MVFCNGSASKLIKAFIHSFHFGYSYSWEINTNVYFFNQALKKECVFRSEFPSHWASKACPPKKLALTVSCGSPK